MLPCHSTWAGDLAGTPRLSLAHGYSTVPVGCQACLLVQETEIDVTLDRTKKGFGEGGGGSGVGVDVVQHSFFSGVLISL